MVTESFGAQSVTNRGRLSGLAESTNIRRHLQYMHINKPWVLVDARLMQAWYTTSIGKSRRAYIKKRSDIKGKAPIEVIGNMYVGS